MPETSTICVGFRLQDFRRNRAIMAISQQFLLSRVTEVSMKNRFNSYVSKVLVCALLLTPAAFAQDDKSATDNSKQDNSKQTSTAQDATQDATQDSSSKAEKKKGSGGKDDVEAIGNRDIGKRGLGNWYSLESEIKMGKAYAQQIEQSVKLVQDPVVNEYVNRIGQN